MEPREEAWSLDFGCTFSDSKRMSARGLQTDHEVLSAQLDKFGVY